MSESELEGLQCFPFHLPDTLSKPKEDVELVAEWQGIIHKELEWLTDEKWRVTHRIYARSVQFACYQEERVVLMPPLDIMRLAASDPRPELYKHAACVTRQMERREGVMGDRSPSYRPLEYSPGRVEHCDRLGADDSQPCWGQVEGDLRLTSPDGMTMRYSCQGHIKGKPWHYYSEKA